MINIYHKSYWKKEKEKKRRRGTIIWLGPSWSWRWSWLSLGDHGRSSLLFFIPTAPNILLCHLLLFSTLIPQILGFMPPFIFIFILVLILGYTHFFFLFKFPSFFCFPQLGSLPFALDFVVTLVSLKFIHFYLFWFFCRSSWIWILKGAGLWSLFMVVQNSVLDPQDQR